ncbi:hypothetical protein J2Z44_002355 [Clostridium punense]|uniref:Uncharacterized protein n=1 Tax=Clostridium punense TaxID=1054297 RepID=A0ABS4K7D6_9CLOT|nr:MULTISPECIES: hypothetical protein [Clostridium]EQB86616.1 hypothetical protein M918_13500 [Clostridium sp. BL8]MBP2022534.1 hypothetical protein [Clostridium punense]
MNKQRRINLTEYKYISSLLGQLLELDIDTEEKITGYIENFGVDNFLNDIELMDLPYDVLEKLESLEQIIEALDDEKEMLKNDKNGGAI